MKQLANNPILNYKKIFDGVNFFIPVGGASNASPAQLLQFHIKAVSWLSENQLRFNTLKSELIKGPKECVFGFNMTAEEILKTGIINVDACIQYLNWDQKDVDFYQQGIFHETILKQDDSYKAVKDTLDGASNEVNRIMTDLELKEIQRKTKIYEKYYQKGIVFGQFIRDTKQKIINIFPN